MADTNNTRPEAAKHSAALAYIAAREVAAAAEAAPTPAQMDSLRAALKRAKSWKAIGKACAALKRARTLGGV